MSLFALSDLHLSFFKEKPMEVFGDNWKDHFLKIKNNWNSIVSDDDTVIIAGDVSWALNIDEAYPDLEFISNLKGRKIIFPGNHDYWWSSNSKVRKAFPQLTFVKNDFAVYENYALCGSRGWLCPNDTRFTENDDKLYKREIIRVRLSIEAALKAGYKDNIILVLHYPPVNDKKEYSEFIKIIEENNIKYVVYGHLHGEDSFKNIMNGVENGVKYMLTSADFVDFSPVKVL
ncbi:serine/threonine protein phosphatase [Tyzzerella sp. An114]|uniref:metallophosphoesterase n=1 Tax=Tyzzerella sp. An114 TaxID=1965545 RepID=UPI000B444EE1|nr:metallophosphoesterase [Tyzzerella sp. An114]OUQ60499.1 serine/threonine protein phosphatase [Tyzzerella sp. An114]HIT73940.1 metallophosphoesterase [Candidatus Fimicola cottocaccae]